MLFADLKTSGPCSAQSKPKAIQIDSQGALELMEWEVSMHAFRGSAEEEEENKDHF